MFIGTHDSCAYKLDFSINFWNLNSKWNWLRILSRCIPYIRRGVSKSTITQNYNILEQLKIGVQVLDIRVSYKKNVFHTNHTFHCEYFLEIVRQIKRYFDETKNANQIHILIKPDWNTRKTMKGQESKFVLLLEKLFLDLIKDEKIICYYKPYYNKQVLYKSCITNFRELKFIWLNSDNTKKFINKFKNYNYEDLSKAILNFVLTMDVQDSKWNLLEIDLKDYANELNIFSYGVKNILDKNNLPYIILLDFVDKDLIKLIQTSNL